MHSLYDVQILIVIAEVEHYEFGNKKALKPNSKVYKYPGGNRINI